MNTSDELEQMFQPYNFELYWNMRPYLEEYW